MSRLKGLSCIGLVALACSVESGGEAPAGAGSGGAAGGGVGGLPTSGGFPGTGSGAGAGGGGVGGTAGSGGATTGGTGGATTGETGGATTGGTGGATTGGTGGKPPVDGGVCLPAAQPTACGVAPVAGCGTPCGSNTGCVSVCQGFECITQCTSQAACKLATIKCSPGQICKVECSKDACEGATIECGDATECKVQCKDDHACKNVKLNCGSGPCSLSCEGHDHACGENTQLKCGIQACAVSCNGFNGPDITCTAACGGCPKACP